MSSVLVKLDENLGQSHAELVRRAGYVTDRVTDQGLSGAADPTVWHRVTSEGRLARTENRLHHRLMSHPDTSGRRCKRDADGVRCFRRTFCSSMLAPCFRLR